MNLQDTLPIYNLDYKFTTYIINLLCKLLIYSVSRILIKYLCECFQLNACIYGDILQTFLSLDKLIKVN